MQILRRVVPAHLPYLSIVALVLSGYVRAQDPPNKPSGLLLKGPTLEVYKVGNGVTAPRTIYAPPAELSEQARLEKYRGVVTLSAIVTSTGTVASLRVIGAAGMGLDENALEAVRRWKFKPAMKDGKPVAVQIAVQVSFAQPD